MKIEFIFAWYDLWIGAYYDRKNHWLYILPFPMLGIIIKLPIKRWFLIDKKVGIYGVTIYPENYTCEKKEYWSYNDDDKPIFKKDMKFYDEFFNTKFR